MCSSVNICDICGVDTAKINEYYMVKDSVWPSGSKILCIGCLENKIGRELNMDDFLPCLGMVDWKYSERLAQRVDKKEFWIKNKKEIMETLEHIINFNLGL